MTQALEVKLIPLPKTALCSGLVRCGTCGAAMDEDREGLYYVCAVDCGNRSIPVRELNKSAIDYVNAVLKPEVREAVVAAIENALRSSAQGRKHERRREVKEATALIGAMERFAQNKACDEETERQLRVTCESLKGWMSDNRFLARASENRQKWVKFVEDYFAAGELLKLDNPYSKQREMVLRYIETITIYPTAIQFTCTFDREARLAGIGCQENENGMGTKTVSADGFEQKESAR